MVNIINYVQLEKTNFITKKISNYSTIISINSKGIIVEIKNLTKETLWKRKVLHSGKLFDITDSVSRLEICILRNTMVKYRCYILYLLEVLEILEETNYED